MPCTPIASLVCMRTPQQWHTHSLVCMCTTQQWHTHSSVCSDVLHQAVTPTHPPTYLPTTPTHQHPPRPTHTTHWVRLRHTHLHAQCCVSAGSSCPCICLQRRRSDQPRVREGAAQGIGAAPGHRRCSSGHRRCSPGHRRCSSGHRRCSSRA